MTDEQKKMARFVSAVDRLKAAERVCEAAEELREAENQERAKEVRALLKLYDAVDEWRKIRGGMPHTSNDAQTSPRA